MERFFKFVLSPEFIAGATVAVLVMQRDKMECPHCNQEFRRVPRLNDQFDQFAQQGMKRVVNGATGAFAQGVTKAVDSQAAALGRSFVPFKTPATQQPQLIVTTANPNPYG